jgi:hypothetical protein
MTRTVHRSLPVLLLALLAAPVPAAELCLANSAANNRNITVLCGGIGWINDWIGYRTGSTYCGTDPFLCYDAPLWTISSSASDGSMTSGPLPDPGVLCLWYHGCGNGWLMQAAEFDLVGVDLVVVGFTPMNGFLNAGTPTALLIAVGGCPSGSVVAGRIDVAATTSVEQDSWGRIKGTYR